MTLPQPVRRYTPEEYLRRERDAVQKHEFYQGEVFGMSGGSFEHSRTIANVIGELRNRLAGSPCGVQDSNLRVRVPRTTLYTYPDASVVCGPPQFDPLDTARQTITNPTVLVEVLSPSTETWDRGGKFDSYRQIESLREYVLVAWDAARVETFLRQPDGTWIFTAAVGLTAVAKLTSIDVDLPLAEVYRGVDLPEQTHPTDKPNA
jgi:Uma2 family endonuclease